MVMFPRSSPCVFKTLINGVMDGFFDELFVSGWTQSRKRSGRKSSDGAGGSLHTSGSTIEEQHLMLLVLTAMTMAVKIIAGMNQFGEAADAADLERILYKTKENLAGA